MHPKSSFIPMIRTLMKRELAGYFGSPVAYVFLVIFLLLSGFFTFYVSGFFEAGQADLQGFFQWHPWLFLFLVPAVAMRLWAEERRLGTFELLMTFPITTTQAVLGKFLAAWCFIGIALFLTFPLVLTTLYLGDPDLGVIFCAYVGSFLVAGVFLSIGSMTSALTRSQVVSFILAVVICLFLILAGFPPVIQMFAGWAPVWLVDGLSQISVITHFAAISRGVLDLRDIFYYLSVMAFMMVASGVILENRESA